MRDKALRMRVCPWKPSSIILLQQHLHLCWCPTKPWHAESRERHRRAGQDILLCCLGGLEMWEEGWDRLNFV